MERLERRFTEARLNALRMQLDPHFLFNALNTISSQVERDPRMARTMIERLGDLLRRSLELRDKEEIPLAEELAFLDHYLAIERIRFGNRLTIDISVDPAVNTRPCCASSSSRSWKTLYGTASRHAQDGGTIVVSARGIDRELQIRVADDGVGLPAGWSLESSAGIGLSLTRDRILGLYPSVGQLVVRPCAEGGTEASVTLPLVIAAEPEVRDAVSV